MIRFRNPGSDLDTIIAVFRQLHNELHEKEHFDNRDIADVLSKANLMASSGFTGGKAVQLGANQNKSRDKTYNNAKMYAEIFRLLGLISTVNEAASNYRFTFAGDHMVIAGADTKALIEQCVLGMNNPNQIMDVSYKESVRFFACVLRMMTELDDILYRDEMILGPMSVNDTSATEYKQKIAYIKNLRETGCEEKLSEELKKLAKSLTDNKKDGMTEESVRNCTRFPISVLKYCGWIEDSQSQIYGKKKKVMKLTARGKQTAEQLQTYIDVRLKDYETLPGKQKRALIRLGVYSMLGRAHFETDSVQKEMEKDKEKLTDFMKGKEILFSPYQTLDLETVNDALHIEIVSGTEKKERQSVAPLKSNVTKIAKSKVVMIDSNAALRREIITEDAEKLITRIGKLHECKKSTEQIVEILMKEHANDNKGEFYPLVEALFRIIGVNCHKSRDGVNGERWDAMIRDEKRSIPIEIKSPGEEQNISIKAIRQALENKIVLLSRKTYITDPETSTFAVGYKAPNNRAEVVELIHDIKKTYGYKVAVFDISSLFLLAVSIVVYKRGIDVEKLYGLEGIVDVRDIESQRD